MSGLVAGAMSRGQAAGRTNVLLITADNLGYGDLGCYGNREMKTPHLDGLAREGVRFTDFYTASPTCTVSRATLLTGRVPQRIGLNHQLSAAENMRGVGLPHSEKLLPEYLRGAGYRTGCIGKWNLGWAPGSRPTERGFDYFFGHRSGNMNYYTHTYNGVHDLYEGVQESRRKGYSTELFAEAASGFVKENAGRPFFLYLPFNAVHYPNPRDAGAGEKIEWQVPASYLEQYGWKGDEADPKRRYMAAVTALDDGVGRVLRELRERSLEENTIVLFYSDNGAFMMPEKGLGVATNLPLRKGGNTLWEGGIRVAAIARWPGVTRKGSVCGETVSSLDLLPTVVAACGGSVRGAKLDGRDVRLAMAGRRLGERSLFYDYLGMSAVRKGRWKIMREKPEGVWQLFDLVSDMGESRDLAGERAALVEELVGEFARWKAQFDKEAL